MMNFDGLNEFAVHRWTTWVTFCSRHSSSRNSSQAHPQGKRTLINWCSQVLRLASYTKLKSWRIILSLGSPFLNHVRSLESSFQIWNLIVAADNAIFCFHHQEAVESGCTIFSCRENWQPGVWRPQLQISKYENVHNWSPSYFEVS